MKQLLVASSLLALCSACNCGPGGNADAGAGGGSAVGGGAGGGGAANPLSTLGAPDANQSTNDFGNGIAVALDTAGNPAVALYSFDPNGDGDDADSVVLFSTYDAVAAHYKTPVVAGHTSSFRKRGLSLAIEGTNVAIAYAIEDATSHKSAISLATSTDGITFTSTTVSTPDADSIGGYLSMAMKNGVVHVAWSQGDDIEYRTGPFATPSTWASVTQLPRFPGNSANANGRLSVACDSAGVVGIVFGMNDTGLGFAYWRPSFATPRRVFDTQNQNDSWGVVLAYAGTSARVAFHAGVKDSDANGIWVTSTSDDTTWSVPVAIPNDGGQAPNDRIAMAVSATGKTAITYPIGGGNLTGTVCGQPKVTRSDSFTAFTTCSPLTSGDYDIDYPAVLFDAQGRLVIAFQNQVAASTIGVLVWRGQ